MIFYSVIFICIGILSISIIYLKYPFIKFAYSTTSLLNIIVERSLDEEAKQKVMIIKLLALLKDFGIFLLFLLLSCFLAISPLIIYVLVKNTKVEDLDFHSFYFYLAMILGSFVLFFYPRKGKDTDYDDWSKLLHRMMLDNYNISRGLFNFEKKIYKKRIQNTSNNFIIVTGLARAGTTAFTNLLYKTNYFYSLSYKNMPFLLSVNLWGKLYNPRKNELKERAHGDNIKFGYKTIEALEEYFYKTQLNDSFILDDSLIKHNITESIFNKYISYQGLIGLKDKNKIYLAKNNNFILRYKSIRSFNKDFIIMMLVRNPVEHADSLLKQHQKFSDMHEKDPFSLEYMNWLGHHEFGLNHKPFQLNENEKSKYSTDSLNYWVNSWVEYYKYVLSFIDEDKKIYIIDYNDLCLKPNEILKFLAELLKININSLDLEPYIQPLKEFSDIDNSLLRESNRVYSELIARKILL